MHRVKTCLQNKCMGFTENLPLFLLMFFSVTKKQCAFYRQYINSSKDNFTHCSDEIHSCLRTFISNTARTATILNRDNTRRQCSKQYSRQCVETDQFWSLLRVNAQAANTR